MAGGARINGVPRPLIVEQIDMLGVTIDMTGVMIDMTFSVTIYMSMVTAIDPSDDTWSVFNMKTILPGRRQIAPPGPVPSPTPL